MDIIEEYKKRRADRMAVNAYHKRRDERIAAKKQLTEGENDDTMLMDAEWEENKHKRAKNGQFSKMSGGGSYKAGNEKSKEKIKSIAKNPSKSKQTNGGTAAQSKAQAQAAETGNAQAGTSAGGAEQTKQQKVAAEKARLAEEYKNGNPHAKSGKNEDGSLYKGKRNFGHGYGITTVGERERNDPKNGITIKANTNEKGEWTPEREAMHQQIIDELIPESIPKAEGTPIYTFMGGGPASGKSFVVKNKGAELGVPSKDKAITIDCDNIKGMLPEFSPVDKAKVSGVHEESSALAKRAKEIGMNEGYNVIDDGTGDGGADKMKKKIAQAKKAGMKVNAVYVTTSIENALEQNASRARSVDEDMLISTHKTISEIFPEIAGDFDHVTLWQNDVGSQPVLIAEGGGGKPLQIKNQKLYDDFIAKKGWTRESMKQDEKDERGFTTGLYANDPETIAYYREKEMLTPREDEIIEAVIAGKTIDDLPFTATQADREKWARAEKQYGKGTGRYFSMVNNAD